MKRSSLMILLGSLTAALTAAGDDRPSVPELPRATFYVEQDTEVKCMARPANADELVRRAGIRVVSWFGNGSSVSIVGAILRETSRLSGEEFRPLRNFAFEVNRGWRIMGQQVYDSNLRMAKVIVTEADNARLIIHEMGHVFGNAPKAGGGTWYKAYNAAVPKACRHTEYAGVSHVKGSRNEEFAEAFAAYLTRPQLLLRSGPACMKAFAFFRKVAFPKADPSCLPKAPVKPIVIPLPRPRPAEAPAPVPVEVAKDDGAPAGP